ncbi:MAG: PHP domain-containing protein [Spirochaetes bacterium]|nr:PHP domain-containing protein [Spirochaetota bacterium]MBU1081099.1 PHP domain-containing protein [Spirochaetota bacterium]
MIDLHTHSTASDGAFSPRDLVSKAAAEGLTALALTDHDSIDGLSEAAEAALELGLRFVPGIEIEIAFEPGEFHLLGLDLVGIQDPLREAAGRLAASREDRNRAVVELLRADGVDIGYAELRELAGAGMIGRPHIAELLVRKKIVKSKQAAFDKYLAKGRPYYVRKACVELSEAIDVVRGSGGLAFVAHPMSLFASWKRLRALFEEWKELGVDGIEAWHPTARLVDCARLDAMAREFGFRVSAGSDYHGAVRPDRRLGHTAGNRKIGEEFLACLER